MCKEALVDVMRTAFDNHTSEGKVKGKELKDSMVRICGDGGLLSVNHVRLRRSQYWSPC